MDPAASPDLFISHSTKDDPEVDRIAEALRAAGLNVWVDHQNGIPIGTPSFDQMIQDNLNKCRRGLLVLTGDSAKSLECNGEWRHLLTHKRLYVARLKDFPQPEFPSRLAIIQYANLLRDYDQGLAALIEALHQDTALAAAHPGTALALRTTGRFPNRKLDLPIIGRDAALAQVSQALTRPGTVVLTGPGGVGKTRLAAELAARAANPAGVVWFELGAAATPAGAATDLDRLTALLREHFDLAPTTLPDAVWATLGASQTLLILDNAEDCQHPQPFIGRLDELNQRDTDRAVLITSRHVWPDLEAALPFPLPLPAAADAERILQDMLNARLPPNRSRPTPAEVAMLAAAARYHPRLLEFATTWLRAYPVAQVTEWLHTLRGGAKPEQALADVMGHTLDLVARQPHGPLALAALRRLLVCRGGFTGAAAKALLADLPGGYDTLDILVAWNLLNLDNNRYDTDLLTRETEAADEAGYPLHYAYYEALARQYNERQDYAGLVPEAANLEVAFEWAMDTGEVEKAYWLANAANEMLHNRGRFAQELAWLERVAAALSAEAEDSLRGALMNSLGISYAAQPLGNRLANLRRAVAAYEAALRHRTEAAAPLDYATTQNNLGTAYSDLAQVSEREANLRRAVAAYEAALVHRTEAAAPLDYATTQNNLGTAYSDLAQVSEREANLRRAVAAYEAALRHYTEAAAPLDYAMTQNNLGTAYRGLSEVSEREANLRRAVAAYEAALRHRTEAAAPLAYAMTQNNLGTAYSDLAQVSEREANLRRAVAAYEAALRHYTEAAAPLDYAMTQNNLGTAYRGLSEVSEREANLRRAVAAYEAALRHYTEAAAPLDYAATQNNLGNAYRGLIYVADPQEHAQKAGASYEEARRVAAAQQAVQPYARATADLGILLEIIGNLPAAIECWREAEKHYRHIGDEASADRMQAWIAEAEEKLRNQPPPAASE